MRIGNEQTLHLGDARNMSHLDSDSVDFIITSPPYWNLKDYGGGARSIGPGDYSDYLAEMNEVWAECFRVAKPGSIMVINVNSRRHQKRFYPIAFDIVSHMKLWTLHDVNVWYIPNALPQPNYYIERLLDNKFEYLLVFTKEADGAAYKFHKPRVPQKYITADPRSEKRNKAGRCVGNVLRIPAYRPPNIKKGNYHVAAYPEELVGFFLQSYTDEGDVVLDPFVGSGTTLKVCEAMQRRGLGYEVNAEFTDLIRNRVDEHWEVPDWKSVDILHSSTMTTGGSGSRKALFGKKTAAKPLNDFFSDQSGDN